MTLAEKIAFHLSDLPETYQAEVLDFVEFLASKSRVRGESPEEERTAWSDFSLAQAMRGLEDEDDLYSLADLKESF
jgi:hypothetical protein